MLRRISQNQTIIPSINKKIVVLKEPLPLEEFLTEHSKSYNNIIEATYLAEGGEAVIFNLEHTGLDEIVIKCPLNKESFSSDEVYVEILIESQMLKLIPHNDYIAQIKEELIEINMELAKLTKYCVIVERAQHSLDDIMQIW